MVYNLIKSLLSHNNLMLQNLYIGLMLDRIKDKDKIIKLHIYWESL